MTANANQQLLQYVDNFVRKDGVIKEQVCLEKLTKYNYNRKWGYYTHLKEICLEIARERGIEKEYKRVTEFKRGRRIESTSNWDIPESSTVPTITSGEVGWRSSRLECNLERLGPLYISPRHTLAPPGTEPEPKLTNIFLG
ncbi:Normal lung function maintenance, Low in Lung Cancer 1 protein [Popillia japonica]|uniref:Normal lung function maintenance, Low in Lung Cancer 1 protein n=1 Tax=Popillia japonica TaxID=7064 RepID=A0AAW1JZ16_POPJA